MDGLIHKYNIQKTNGEPLDEGSEYFVLRLDKGGDREHVIACRKAITAYANHIVDTLPELANDLMDLYGSYRSIMTVKEIGENDIKVVMAQWDMEPHELISIPNNIIPSEILSNLKVDDMMIAEVNIQTYNVEDLFFYDFQKVSIDKTLDEIKSVKLASNKLEELQDLDFIFNI